MFVTSDCGQVHIVIDSCISVNVICLGVCFCFGVLMIIIVIMD